MFGGRTSETQSGKPSVRSVHSNMEAAEEEEEEMLTQSEMWFVLLRAEKELWIKEKYVEKRFVRSSSSEGESESPESVWLLPLSRSSLTPSLCCRSGGGQCWIVSGCHGRRLGRNGSGVGPGGRGQQEHQRGGGAHSADRSRYRGKR